MMQNNDTLIGDLIWQIEAGIDECVAEKPQNRFVKPKEEIGPQKAEQKDRKLNRGTIDHNEMSSDQILIGKEKETNIRSLPRIPKSKDSAPERAVVAAVASSGMADSISDLESAVNEFDECVLKKTAINTVFADGNPSARIMFIGQVPGADEDRKGIPFVGPGGQFLDKMLASVGIDRDNCYMTNGVFWRPPGDREATANEIAACMPFVERHIELVLPEILILLGGPVSRSLLGMSEGITKIHGQWFEYSTSRMASPIQAMPLYHPNNLLGAPVYKKAVWQNLLKIKHKLM